jgi:hypothetical protein
MRISYPENFVQTQKKESPRVLRMGEEWIGTNQSVFADPCQITGYLDTRNQKVENVNNGLDLNEFIILQRQPDKLTFEFLDKILFISAELREIFDEIEHSKYIATLKNNWDEDGALPIPTVIYWTAIDLLVNYSEQLLEKNIIIRAPEINPAPNGSIHLSWRTEQARLLISLKLNNGEPQALFYRDNHNNKGSNKGELPLSGIDESFLVWMKNLK